MNVDNVISRATHTTGRSLIAVSAGVLLGRWFDHDLTKLPIIESTFGKVSVDLISTIPLLIIFLLVAHLLNWFNDFLTYRTGILFEIHRRERAVSASDNLLLRAPEDKEMQRESNPKAFDDLLIEFKNNTSATRVSQFVLLYGLHLFFPVILGILSASIGLL